MGPPGGGAVAGIVDDQVGRQEWIVGLIHPLFQHRLTPVKLVVAEGSSLVAHEVEQINGGGAIREVREQAALHLITGVNQQHVVGAYGAADVVDDLGGPRNAGVAAGRFQVAVEVIGVENGEGVDVGEGNIVQVDLATHIGITRVVHNHRAFGLTISVASDVVDPNSHSGIGGGRSGFKRGGAPGEWVARIVEAPWSADILAAAICVAHNLEVEVRVGGA
ncbi:MAG: hypothetical protein BWY63_03202 [Chloroflexi bacterium ADurb.Bin360]|nr:MAG: hypothetical protein BWY63_03202 [Chloroflexi bacterium ADurb.Bin360]